MGVRHSNWDRPLTARQLVTIIVVIACVVGLAVMISNGRRNVAHANAVTNCAVNAPWGWDCERYPTGYPR